MKHMKFPRLESQAVLSPMVGVTDVAFRALAKRYGAGLTYTEFVSSAGLIRGKESILQLVKIDPSEKPVAVQLFGSNVEEVVKAAQLMEKQFDIIDVNCGCPAWKVMKTGAGSELLRKPEGIGKFVYQLTSAVKKPITVKMRIGIDNNNINAVEVAKIVEANGAAALAIHGRTQEQGYSGEANWDIIKEVKEAVSIPVIGNGDVFTPEVFQQRLEASGVDAIMIARGAMGNPYIFQQIKDYVRKGTYEKKDGIEQFFAYLELAEKYTIDFFTIKNHAVNFTKGMKGGAKLREQIVACTTLEVLKKIMEEALLKLRVLQESQ